MWPSDVLLSSDLWADRAEEAPDFMIDGWLHAETNIITGKATVGKTRLTAAMAAAVARGDSTFCGAPVHKHGPVMVLSTDAGEAQRWGLRMREHGVIPASRVGIGRFQADRWDRYIKIAGDVGCKLLILDNVNGALRGNESIKDDAPARRLTHPLTEIAEAGTTVVLVTHSAKNYEAGGGRVTPKGAMGSTVYEAFARGAVHLHDANEPNVRYVATWSNDYPQRELVLGVDWRRASADWRLLREREDKRPRTDVAHAGRVELFEHVTRHPELRVIRSKAEIGRRLHAAGVGEYDSSDAARKAFERAARVAGGSYIRGAWQAAA